MPAADRIRVLGCPLDAVDFAAAVEAVSCLVGQGGVRHVVTANLDYLGQMAEDVELARIVERADLVVADGVPLLWMARWQGTPLPSRVNGTDLVQALLERAGPARWRVCLVGGEPGVAAAAGGVAEQRYGAHIVGAWGPSRAEMDDPATSAGVATAIRSASPDLLLLGLGAGRQDHWIAGHRSQLGDVVVIGVGSALDFIAGRHRRAPRWMQRAGLEWLWRLASEPRRLWRRYLIDGPGVLFGFFRERHRRP